MFYDAKQIESVLTCSKCHNNLVSQAFLLPCGYTLCTNCNTNLKSILNQDSFQFNCSLCNELHNFPKDGLPTNKMISKILEQKPKGS